MRTQDEIFAVLQMYRHYLAYSENRYAQWYQKFQEMQGAPDLDIEVEAKMFDSAFSLQQISIPGYCKNQDIYTTREKLSTSVDILSWVLDLD